MPVTATCFAASRPSVFGKSDEGLIHEPGEPAIRATGNGVGFVQKSFRSQLTRGQHGRRAGESAHREHSVGAAAPETVCALRARIASSRAGRRAVARAGAPRQGKVDDVDRRALISRLVDPLPWAKSARVTAQSRAVNCSATASPGKRWPPGTAASDGDADGVERGGHHMVWVAGKSSAVNGLERFGFRRPRLAGHAEQ